MTPDLTLEDIEIGDDGYMVGRAHFRISAEYDHGSWDADGRQASRSGWCVDATLIGFQIGALTLTRDQLILAASAAHVEALEEDAAEHEANMREAAE